MKKFYKVCALAMSVISIGSLCACGNGGTSDDRKERANNLEVVIFNGGYGYEWMQDVANYYMDNIDQNTYVEVKQTVLNAEEATKVNAGLGSADIYFLEQVYSSSKPFADLSDLLDAYPTGETEHTIREKMGENIYAVYNTTDNWFQMPYSNNHVYNFVYNKTTLDEALGASNYVLPRTTKELFEMGDALKEKGVYLYAGAYGDHNDYFHYQFPVWFAQVAGKEGYDKYLSGEYFDKESGEWKLAESEPLNISYQKTAYMAMYESLLTLCRSDNGYSHPQSNAMTFTNLEMAFYGYGFGLNKKKVAFISNGPWVENEINTIVKVMGEEPDQEIGVLKMPIASEILYRLPSITGSEDEKEAKLREVISYVDGDSDSKPSNVSDEDIEAVREARTFVGSLTTGSAVVPKDSNNISGAKEFLKFCASDVAREISAKATKGINMLGYDAFGMVELENSSSFVKTLNQVIKGVNYVESNAALYDFMNATGFSLVRQSELPLELSVQSSSNLKDAETFYNDYYSHYANRWSSMIEEFNSKTGR